MNQSEQSKTNAESNEPTGFALILTPNIADGDDFYDELLYAHENLDKEASDAFNARLILLLCNHIGDRAIIRQAIEAAASKESSVPAQAEN